MAYDRYDTRNTPRDERSRWRDDRFEDRDRGGPDDRGFFDRAGDEIASWFGDDEAERRRREDRMRDEREGRYSTTMGAARTATRAAGASGENAAGTAATSSATRTASATAGATIGR